MIRLSFKQYLNSKQQLLEAIQQSPIYVQKFVLEKYCKFPVGQTKQEKQFLALRPKTRIVVEWKQIDEKTRVPLSVGFENARKINESERYSLFWNNDKFNKWLSTNTYEDIENYTNFLPKNDVDPDFD